MALQLGKPGHRHLARPGGAGIGQVQHRQAAAPQDQADARPVGQVDKLAAVKQAHLYPVGYVGRVHLCLVREFTRRHYDPPIGSLRYYRGVELLHYGASDRAVRLVLALDDRQAAVVAVYKHIPAAVGHAPDQLDAPPSGTGKNVPTDALELEPVDHVKADHPGSHGAGGMRELYSPCTGRGCAPSACSGIIGRLDRRRRLDCHRSVPYAAPGRGPRNDRPARPAAPHHFS